MSQASPHQMPYALYIHLPYCVQKCPYCDFNSHGLQNNVMPEDAYIQALLVDLEHTLAMLAQRPINSIFFGGGTPSLFKADSFNTILQFCHEHANLNNDIEITLEANPGTQNAKNFEGYRKIGINRLSIGAQSFNDGMLKKLGRIHDSKAIFNTVRFAKSAGFDNFNLDLMFALPQQSPQAAIDDLTQAISLQPTHISRYQLTLEPNTYFHQNPPSLPKDDTKYEMYTNGIAQLARHGYHQYEISNFCQTNHNCQHNSHIWQYGDYAGVGAGAHGKISQENGQIMRTIKPRHPKAYMQNPIDTAQSYPTDTIFEYLLNHLRLKQPINIKHLETMTGKSISTITQQIATATKLELMHMTDTSITLTKRGYVLLDSVLEIFIGESNT